jgi:hypothetical protein
MLGDDLQVTCILDFAFLQVPCQNFVTLDSHGSVTVFPFPVSGIDARRKSVSSAQLGLPGSTLPTDPFLVKA